MYVFWKVLSFIILMDEVDYFHHDLSLGNLMLVPFSYTKHMKSYDIRVVNFGLL